MYVPFPGADRATVTPGTFASRMTPWIALSSSVATAGVSSRNSVSAGEAGEEVVAVVMNAAGPGGSVATAVPAPSGAARIPSAARPAQTRRRRLDEYVTAGLLSTGDSTPSSRLDPEGRARAAGLRREGGTSRWWSGGEA
ncbi:hypothetical protein GCM10010230_46750 [Streptomyces narbonensis]|nr:hypothetical protein GCM10010230_46750 [Streptomyces narbonensis]